MATIVVAPGGSVCEVEGDALIASLKADGWTVQVEAAAEQPDGEAPKGNASREEWAAYADSIGVEYDEDAKRDDIQAAVEAAAEQPE